MARRTKAIIIGAVGVVALLFSGAVLSSCATQIGPGQTAIKVDDYLLIPADPKVDGCIDPETSAFNPPGGFKAYRYPSRQISWDATGSPDSEAEPTIFTLPSRVERLWAVRSTRGGERRSRSW